MQDYHVIIEAVMLGIDRHGPSGNSGICVIYVLVCVKNFYTPKYEMPHCILPKLWSGFCAAAVHFDLALK